MVDRMVVVVDIVDVEANLGRKEFRVNRNVFGAGIAVKPRPIGESERC